MTNYFYRGKQIKTGDWKCGTLDIFLDDKDDLLYHIRKLDNITNTFQASTVDSKTVSKCIDYTGDFKTSIFECCSGKSIYFTTLSMMDWTAFLNHILVRLLLFTMKRKSSLVLYSMKKVFQNFLIGEIL